MSWLNLLGVAFGLAMDAFAVAVAAGLSLKEVTPRHVFRLAFHFGLFQALMPVIGYFAGSALAGSLAAYSQWICFVMLTFVGGKMLWESRADEAERIRSDPTRGLTLVTLSVATSLDALAVGLTLALLGETVWEKAAVIGLVAAALTAAGISFGNRLGPRWQQRAEVIGGAVLILIGARVLFTHLTT